MDKYTATEIAYKNGYAKGYVDGVNEFAEGIFKLFPNDKNFTTISRFRIGIMLKEMVGADNACD